MDRILFQGVAGFKSFGTLADRPLPDKSTVWSVFLQEDVDPPQISLCLRFGTGEEDFLYFDITGTGGLTPAITSQKFARTFDYVNANPSFTNVVQVAQTSVSGHQLITATFIGNVTQIAGSQVTFRIIDLVSSTVVFELGPFAWNGDPTVGQGTLTFTTTADIGAGNREWTLQAMASAGNTLTGIYGTIVAQDGPESFNG